MDKGEYCEGMDWEILIEDVIDVSHSNATCKHAVFVRSEDQKRSDGSVYGTSQFYRVPRLIKAYNEAGYNCTLVCGDCIAEELEKL